MAKINNTLVTRLKQQMHQSNINARELAERAGLGRSFVYDMLNGKSANPTTQKLSAIAEVLGVNVLYLMGESDNPQKTGHRTGQKIEAQGAVANVSSLVVEKTSGGATLVTEGEDTEGYLFKKSWIKEKLKAEPSDLRIVFVQDDSMKPTLSEGDVVLINLNDRTPDASAMFVVFKNQSLLVRRVESINQTLCVRSDSRTEDVFEVAEKKIQVVGRVVWFAREI